MKFFLSFSILACIVSFTGFAQTISYIPFGTSYSDGTSSNGCQTDFTVSMIIGALPETGGVLSVDWGDGNTSTHNYTTATGNTFYNIPLSHGYSVAGSYQVSFDAYSGTAGANVGNGRDTILTSPGPLNCGYLHIHTNHINPAISFTHVPYQFTDVNGNITIITPEGPSNQNSTLYTGLNPSNAPYTVQVDPNWLATNGLIQSSANLNVTSFDANGAANPLYYSVDITCNASGTNPDFGINHGWATNIIAPAQTGYLSIRICNYACSNPADVSVSVEMPANFIPNTSNLPNNAVFSGTTLAFDLLSLSDCEHFTIPFSFPGNTPAQTTVCFDVTLTNPNDLNSANNTDYICGIVKNSYDPNEKVVNQPTNVDPDQLEEFEYVVHFQNDGNYNALGVVIRDTISPNLDLSTLKVVDSKHPVTTSINPTNRVVTFAFNSINLGQSAVDLEASKGFVVYSISELPNLPVGTEIENTAYIYFDFNPPIVTNTTYNINELPLGLSENKTEQIVLYPNPAQNKLHFSGSSVKKVSIYDLAGKRVLEEEHISANELSLNSIQTGIYQVVLQTENAISTQKLVIQK